MTHETDLTKLLDREAIREAVGRICADFDDEYWRKTDETGDFPEAFAAAMAAGGWLGVALTGSDTSSNVLFGNLQKVTAEQLGLSPKTVHVHRANRMDKLKVSNNVELAHRMLDSW